MRTGDLNGVPGCPGWRYGLAVRHRDGVLSVPVMGPDGREAFRVEGERYWADVHQRARMRITGANAPVERPT